MAQTIAMQRGLVSVSWDNSTATTLFTQSSGTATRVIWGGLEAYVNSQSGGTLLFGLWILSSGSSSTPIPIAFKSSGGNSGKGSLSMFPDGTTGRGMHTAWQTNTAAMTSAQAAMVGNQGGSSYASGPASNKIVNMSNNGDTSVQSTIFEAYPSNFWMGPSDILVFKGYSGSGGSGAVLFNFTTITES